MIWNFMAFTRRTIQLAPSAPRFKVCLGRGDVPTAARTGGSASPIGGNTLAAITQSEAVIERDPVGAVLTNMGNELT